MPIIFLKFIETGTRAVFVVLTTYTLSLSEAGQFSLVVTMQGLASFAFGYERHVDIQRKMVGEPYPAFNHAVGDALTLFLVNYIFLIPLYIIILIFTAKISMGLIWLCIIIAIAEQLMNQAYQMSMVNARYLPFLLIATIKNIFILSLILGNIFFLSNPLSLELVLQIWAVVSAIIVVLSAFIWYIRSSKTTHIPDEGNLSDRLRSQYKASRTHFLLGLTAILTLQIDRLTIGLLLPLETVGIYFRHILVLSLVYQVFNIAFFNRIVPKVFLQAKTETITVLRKLVSKEYISVLVFVALIMAAGLGLHWVTNSTIADRFSLNPYYFIGLLLAATLRMRADFNALIFNARMRESTVLKLQLVAFFVGALLMIILTGVSGIPGTIASLIIASMLYLVLTQYALKPLAHEEMTHA